MIYLMSTNLNAHAVSIHFSSMSFTNTINITRLALFIHLEKPIKLNAFSLFFFFSFCLFKLLLCV